MTHVRSINRQKVGQISPNLSLALEQEQYCVLIQKPYSETNPVVSSIYKLLHCQVYITEQHGRALLTSCMSECTRTHVQLCA